MDITLQYVVAALATASIYALISMGITLVYGVARIMNVSHAILFVLSSFFTYELVHRGWPFVLAAAASLVAVTILGGLIYLLVFDRVRDRPYNSLVISLGLVVIGEATLHLVWDVDVYRIDGWLSRTGSVGGVHFSYGAIASVIVAVLVMIGLAVVLRGTEVGRAMRAVAENPGAARLLGIRSRRVSAGIFMAGTALAALAGSLIGTFVPFSSGSSDVFVLKAFAIAIVGGLGSPVGAVVASALFAAAEIVPVSQGYAQWSQPALFLVMVVVLSIRPSGLFGKGSDAHAADDHLPAATSGRGGRLATSRSLGTLAAAVVVLFVLPYLTSSDKLHGLGAYALCLVIAAIAVWVPLHFVAVPSLAHAALFGIGAYTAAIEMQHWDVNIWVQLVTAAACCLVAALVLGVIAMRSTSLPSIAIITLALGGLVVSVISNLTSVTGGLAGLTIVRPLSIFGTDYGPRNSDTAIYRIALVVVAVMLLLAWLLRRSRIGKQLLASRDSAPLAEAIGLNTYLLRVGVFTVSGLFVGFGGVLYAYFSLFVEPTAFDNSLAIDLLLVVLLGGAVSIYGPLIGVAILVFLPEVTSLDGDASRILYGAVLVLIASFTPAGIASWADPRLWRRARDGLRSLTARPVGAEAVAE